MACAPGVLKDVALFALTGRGPVDAAVLLWSTKGRIWER